MYYHNTQTKQSQWTIPPELEEIKVKIANEKQAAIMAAATSASTIPAGLQQQQQQPNLPNMHQLPPGMQMHMQQMPPNSMPMVSIPK